MQLTQDNHDVYVPDAINRDRAFARTTHLGIGAHQDDLEFMALHGILAGFQRTDTWFGGITCTDGAGSSRSGAYAEFDDEAMKAVRFEEQKTAAKIGRYSFMAQLSHPSQHAKSPGQRDSIAADIAALLKASRPEVVYTHNPFDKHATHVGVMLATLDAIRSIPPEERPKQLFGCEVWRGLDWLPDSEKTVHDVSDHPNLAASLNGVFDSQIVGGKRYDLAVEGRRMANATFFDSHSVDDANRVQYAIDLSRLIEGRTTLDDLMSAIFSRLSDEITGQLQSLREN